VAFVDDADVQIHLPIDKLRVETIPDDKDDAYEDAERIIRGYLAGVFESATIASWISPETTPSQIRAVAGRFAAAKIYRVRYSENSLTDPEYAQVLYNEAMAMLNAIIAGDILLDDVEDVTSGFDNLWFLPNADSDDPIFAMGDRY
jgi:hypothetical protein